MTNNLVQARALKERIRGRTPALGAQIGFQDAGIAELLGRAGFDWLLVDTEHSANGPATMIEMLRAGSASGTVVLARPMRLDVDEIRRYLDLGSPGVICPFIETREMAERLVAACKYPPYGTRGYGPRRAGSYGFDADEYHSLANDAVLCVPIIESEAAVNNIEEIVSVDGIDAVMIGPVDLSISLGEYKAFESARYQEAEESVREACASSGVAMGTGCYSIDHAAACVDAGDTLLLVASDEGLIGQSSTAILERLRRSS